MPPCDASYTPANLEMTINSPMPSATYNKLDIPILVTVTEPTNQSSQEKVDCIYYFIDEAFQVTFVEV